MLQHPSQARMHAQAACCHLPCAVVAFTPSRALPAPRPRVDVSAAPPQTSVGLPPEMRAAGGMDPSTQPEQMRQSYASSIAQAFLKVNLDYPGLKVQNMDPPIFTIDDFISAEICDQLTTAATASGRLVQSQIGGPTTTQVSTSQTASIRTSRSLAMTQEVLNAAPSLGPPLEQLLGAACDLFVLEPAQLRKSLFSRPTVIGQVVPELPQIAHYQPGQHFLSHEDAFPPQAALQKGYQRRGTLLVYLNDVKEGGSTRFDRLGFGVQPKKGKALLFFPSFSGGMPDARTLHTAVDAVDEKWVFQLWLSSAIPVPKPPPQQQAAPAKRSGSTKSKKRR